MTYAFLIEGLDAEGRAKIDNALNGPALKTEGADVKEKARRQREALKALRSIRE